MYEIKPTNQFGKNYQLCIKRNLKIELLDILIRELHIKGTVPLTNKPHILIGNYKGIWECHIKPDWLLLWEKEEKNKRIILLGTGTHSDLFK
jgi:mRNA interferase YafQ